MDQLIGGGKPGKAGNGAPAGDLVKDTNTASFRADVLDASMQVPVIVDFWAPWCGPCRMIAPLVEELAKENAGAVKVGKINIDDNPNIAASYGVSSIPTIMIFKGGEVVERFVGVQPKKRLQEALEQAK
jgi:thioredoxin